MVFSGAIGAQPVGAAELLRARPDPSCGMEPGLLGDLATARDAALPRCGVQVAGCGSDGNGLRFGG